MRKLKTTIFAIVLSLSVANSAENGFFTDNVLNSFVKYYEEGIDEKLYLQTDKPYYSAGENIWFKGFLVNALTHTPFERTNFIYAELIDDKGELVSRIKVQRDSTGFNGYFTLDPKMEEGNYSIRAYTKWMTNGDEKFFFEKNISIVSPIPEDSMVGMNGEKPNATAIARTERLKEKEAEIAKEKAKNYNVQFMPEGGALVEGVAQVVAFKALAEDGLSVEIEGAVYDSQDEKVCDIKSICAGMGRMMIIAQPAQNYYAKVTIQGQSEYKRFELPVCDPNAVALKVSQMGDNVYYQPLAADTKLLDGLNMVLQSRGVVVQIDSTNMTLAHSLPRNVLLDGVSVLSLVNQQNEIVAERVIFKRPASSPTIDIITEDHNYGKRTKARVSLNITGSDGLPTQGEFAVSVTDDSSVKLDSLGDNAVSYLLLSSEIKGHIENPGQYFAPNSDSNLDLLMLTQGWRRYDLEKILSGDIDDHKYPYEDYVRISGSVRGLLGGKANKPKLKVFCLKPFVQEICELGENDSFNLLGLDVPDSTTYVLQTEGRFGGNGVNLTVEPEVFPEPKAGIFPRLDNSTPFDFVDQSREKFFYDGGLSMIMLESVQVTTIKNDNFEANYRFATRSVGRDKLEKIGKFSMSNYFRTFPGAVVRDDSVYYRNDTVPARFIVNGVDDSYFNLGLLTAEHIERIDFYYGNEAMMFTEAEGGVFCITLRDGVDIPARVYPHVARVKLLGYQRVAHFYQPTYETPSQISNLPPDYRTTIFWSGDINPDENGCAEFEFYTADKPTTYTITVEGVTKGGEICHSKAKMLRTKQ